MGSTAIYVGDGAPPPSVGAQVPPGLRRSTRDTISHTSCAAGSPKYWSRGVLRQMALQVCSWLVLEPAVEVAAIVRVGGARRLVIAALAHHRIRALWTSAGSKRVSTDHDA